MTPLGSRSLTRRTFASGSRVDGRWVEGTASTSTFTGSLQPLNGDELQTLPEGERQRKSRKVYTTTALYAGGVSAERRADQVVDGSDTWDVRSVSEWDAVLGHYKAILLAPQEALG